jgi:ribonuclease PH
MVLQKLEDITEYNSKTLFLLNANILKLIDLLCFLQQLMSTCVNAATLALLDGGCPLRHTVAGVTIIHSGNQLIIDPNLEQMKKVATKYLE